MKQTKIPVTGQAEKNKPKQRIVKIKNAPASERSDGRETREHIIECAGKLFALHGYDKTTSKSICKMARVNLAAVNYHFGSRDGLYIAVLEEVHNRLTEFDSLAKIETSSEPPRQKLEMLLDFFITSAFQRNNWEARLWAREIFTPSPFLHIVISRKVLPKFSIGATVFSEYLQYSSDDPRLYAAMLQIMSPFVILFLGQNHPLKDQLPVHVSQETLLRQMRDNALKTALALRNPG